MAEDVFNKQMPSSVVVGAWFCEYFKVGVPEIVKKLYCAGTPSGQTAARRTASDSAAGE